MKNFTTTVGARISLKLNERLERAADRTVNIYAPTVSQIITRGIELALEELKKAPKKSTTR